MTAESKPTSIKVMDKEYLVSCADEEREQLLQAAELLNQKMQELRASGKVIGTERIAVMAALNLAGELLEYQNHNSDYASRVDNDIQRLRQKIESALTKVSV